MKKYYVYLDILGFDALPKQLALETNFEDDFIREQCFSKPTEKQIEKIEEEEEYSVIRGTDDWVILVNNLNSVYDVINMIASVKTYHKGVRFVPFELAIDTKEIDDTKITEYKNRNETIQFLKTDIISAYKDYHKHTHNNESVEQTFVIYTPAFHEELAYTSRHIFSQPINHNGKSFFLADLEIMRDIKGTLAQNRIEAKKFLDKVNSLGVWNQFELKSFLYRAQDDNKWKLQFLYIRLLNENENQNRLQGLQREHIILVHEFHDINHLSYAVNQLIWKSY